MTHARQRGLTLLEVLVVLVIISILATMAVLSARGLGGGGTRLEQELRRLTTLMDLAGEEALMQGRDIGLRIEPNSYNFYALDPDTGTWYALGDEGVFRSRTLPEGVRIELHMEGQEVTIGEEQEDLPAPQVLILSSGELTPFELEMESEHADFRYRVVGLPFGGTEVTLEDI